MVPAFAKVLQLGGETLARAGAATLHGPYGHSQPLGGLGYRIPLDIDGDDGSTLLRRQRCQCLFDGQAHVHSCRVIAVIAGFLRILGRQRKRGPRFVASDPVEAGIDHDGVEPTTHRRVAAELRGLAVRGQQTLLESVGRILVRVARTPGNVP